MNDLRLPDDRRVIHIPANKQGCCPCPCSLVVLKGKIVVLGLALTLGLKPLLTFLLVCYEYLILHKIWLQI